MVTQTDFIARRRYRDSAYSILAALYEEYQGPMENMQKTEQVKTRAKNFTDYEMDFDPSTGRHGAWKAKDELVRQGYVCEGKAGGCKTYCLSGTGARICNTLFKEIFHPSRGEYTLVEPLHGRVDARGKFRSDNDKSIEKEQKTVLKKRKRNEAEK